MNTKNGKSPSVVRRALSVLKIGVIAILFIYLFGVVIGELVPGLSYFVALALGTILTVIIIGILMRTQWNPQS